MRKPVLLLISLLLTLAIAVPVAAAPFTPLEPRSVLVTLVGMNGAPLSDASIQLLEPGNPMIMTAQTDSRGQAILALPHGFSFWLRAWADGYAVVEHAYVPFSDGTVLTLRATPYSSELLGLVTDERGRPVEGAEVSVWAEGRGHEATAITTKNGSYRITDLRAEGVYTLQIVTTGYQPVVQQNVVLVPGTRNQLDAGLTLAEGTITGEAVDARNRRPVLGARVELLLPGWGVVDVAQTNSFGSFRFAAPPAAAAGYQLRFWAPGYEVQTSAPFSANAGSWTDFSGADRFELNPLYAELTGYVLDQNGSALTETNVELQLLDIGTIDTIQTDDEGFYRFAQLPAGTYRIRAIPERFLERGDTDWIALTGGQRATADVSANSPDLVTYGSSAIVGTVRDHLGEPLSGAIVTAVRGDTVTMVTTDDHGRYRLNAAANVEDKRTDPEISTGYHLSVVKPEFLSSDQVQTTGGALPPSLIDVRIKVTNRADFTLHPTYGELAGQVLDDRGQPLSGLTIALRREGQGEVSRTKTDELGRYHFSRLAIARQPRFVPVVVGNEGYRESSIAPDGGLVALTDLTPGEITSRTLTVRPATGTITGTVRSGAVEPAIGASVTILRPADGKAWFGTTGEQGIYAITIEARPGDQLLMRIGSDGALRNTVAGPISLGADYGVVVNASVVSLAAISGRVFGTDGRPAPFTWVALWAEGTSGQFIGQMSDRDGRFEFTDLAPGRRYAVATWGGDSLWSTLAPGEPILTPLVTPAPGETIWADVLRPFPQ